MFLGLFSLKLSAFITCSRLSSQNICSKAAARCIHRPPGSTWHISLRISQAKSQLTGLPRTTHRAAKPGPSNPNWAAQVIPGSPSLTYCAVFQVTGTGDVALPQCGAALCNANRGFRPHGFAGLRPATTPLTWTGTSV